MNALVSRRALLGAAPTLAMPMALLPAALAAAEAPAAPTASASDPTVALYREWRQARDAWAEALDRTEDDTPETDALGDEEDRLGRLLEEATATTPEGILGQLAFMEVDFWDGRGSVCNVPVAFLHRIAAAVRGLQ